MIIHQQLELLFEPFRELVSRERSHRGPAPPLQLPGSGFDCELSDACAQMARKLGLPRLGRRVEVHWNRRLRSSAGLADYAAGRIELNPRLLEFAPEEPMHTLRHEMAHLVAHVRAGRRRIQTHGPEWRQACADLGIPGESACHTLPLPRSRMRKKYRYTCPACGSALERVRRMRYVAACYDCCRKHNRGRFSTRYRLVEGAMGEGG